MTTDERTGCWPGVLGGVLGAVSGAAAGFVIGLVDAPEVDPADPLEHEWYTPFALIVVPFLGLMMGGLAGAFAGPFCRRHGWRVAAGAYAGLSAGVALGKLLQLGLGEAFPSPLHLTLATACAVAGFLFASSLGSGVPGPGAVTE